MKIFNSTHQVYTSFEQAQDKLSDIDTKSYNTYDALSYLKDEEKRQQLKDYVFSGFVTEDKYLTSDCKVCGYQGLRYLYEIVNHDTHEKIFPVGSECIKHFCDAAYDRTMKSPLFLCNAFTGWAVDVTKREPIKIFTDVVDCVYDGHLSPKQFCVLIESGYRTGIPLPYMLIRPNRREYRLMTHHRDGQRDWSWTASEFLPDKDLDVRGLLMKHDNHHKRYKMELHCLNDPPEHFRFYGVCYSTEIEKLAVLT